MAGDSAMGDCSSKTRWIVVTGGVVSGLGKGIVTSSIAALLQTQGFKVDAVKIDPYINIDAGTMRPTVHGEVYVTFDGGETDQDLGNYERFLDYKISRRNNITTGQVYQEVIRKERNLEYGGSDVQIMKHVVDEVKDRLFEAAAKHDADFVVVEIGGTTGDYENVVFLEAVRQMKQDGCDMLNAHVSYLPVLSNVGEMKTKPTQQSVRALNAAGIFADIIFARGAHPVDAPRRKKISTFCNVAPVDVISAPDMSSIYAVPAAYLADGVGVRLLDHFGLQWRQTPQAQAWVDFAQRLDSLDGSVCIGVVGKYFDIGDYTLEDSYISVIEAIKSAAYAAEVNPKVVWIDAKEFEDDPSTVAQRLESVDGVIVPGGFGKSGVEGKIDAIRYCREHNIPFLGICYGLQLAVIEHARNVVGLQGASSIEFDEKTPHPVVAILPEQAKLLAKQQYGNTMRLGDYNADLQVGSLVAGLYGSTSVLERHRHRFEVNPEYVDKLSTGGLVFSGTNPEHGLVEFLERKGHPFFVATQAHPEFMSRPLKPQPLFKGLIDAAIARRK